MYSMRRIEKDAIWSLSWPMRWRAYGVIRQIRNTDIVVRLSDAGCHRKLLVGAAARFVKTLVVLTNRKPVMLAPPWRNSSTSISSSAWNQRIMQRIFRPRYDEDDDDDKNKISYVLSNTVSVQSFCCRPYTNFIVRYRIPNFPYLGNKTQSMADFSDTVILSALKDPLFGARFSTRPISLL